MSLLDQAEPLLRNPGWDTLVRNSLHASFAVCGSSVKQVSHSWHIVLDTDTLYTFLNFINQFISLLNLHLESELIIVNIDFENLHSVYRSFEIHNCGTDFVMVAEPARDQIPEWDGQANTLERFEEDVPKDRKVTLGPKLLQQFPKGSPQREIGLELLKSGVLQLEDGATQLLELIRLRLGKDLQQDVSEHYKRFLHRSARLYQQSMQHYIAEESNLHERALQAVKSVTTSSKTETETETDSKEKEIIADVLRGFLLLENAALTGSEQVFVFGVAGKSYAYNHIANASREIWGNDERLRSHDSALSQQLQSGHLAGGVHWSAEDNEWTEADYDCEESLDPWSSEWYDPEGKMTSTFPKN